MRLYVQPSPRGGWNVMASGSDAPVSHHDTVEEAEAHANAYARGVAASRTAGPAGEEVKLPDGSIVIVRPVDASDKELFLAGFDRLGEESRYRRFLGFKKRLTESDLEFFTELDHHDHEAIGALDATTGDGVGVARMVRLPDDPNAAEASVAVVDDWQGRGLGRALLERLAKRAAEEGVERFRASLLTSNRAMIRLFDRPGCMRVHRGGGEVAEIDVELPVGGAPGEEMRAALRSAAAGELEPAR